MADQLPINFPLPGENIIASYDFIDVQEGFGYQMYYLTDSIDSTGTTYEMGKNEIFSSDIEVIALNTDLTTTFYSGAFARPVYMKGTVKFSFCSAVQQSGVGQTAQINVKLYHYDGSTSTQLGSTWQSAVMNLTAGNVQTIHNGKIVVTGKKFKRGEIIKMEVIIDSTGGNNHISFGIDPQNRDGSYITPSTVISSTTQFLVFVPYRIEI